jgi:hypothetical protein
MNPLLMPSIVVAGASGCADESSSGFGGAAGTVGWRSRSAIARAAWLGLPMSSGFTVPPDPRAPSLANIAAAAATWTTVPPGALPIMLSVDIRA